MATSFTWLALPAMVVSSLYLPSSVLAGGPVTLEMLEHSRSAALDNASHKLWNKVRVSWGSLLTADKNEMAAIQGIIDRAQRAGDVVNMSAAVRLMRLVKRRYKSEVDSVPFKAAIIPDPTAYPAILSVPISYDLGARRRIIQKNKIAFADFTRATLSADRAELAAIQQLLNADITAVDRQKMASDKQAFADAVAEYRQDLASGGTPEPAPWARKGDRRHDSSTVEVGPTPKSPPSTALATIRWRDRAIKDAVAQFRRTEADCWKRVLQADQAEVRALAKFAGREGAAGNNGLQADAMFAERRTIRRLASESAGMPFPPSFRVHPTHKYTADVAQIVARRTAIADSAFMQMLSAGAKWHVAMVTIYQNVYGSLEKIVTNVTTRLLRRSAAQFRHEIGCQPFWFLNRVDAASSWQMMSDQTGRIIAPYGDTMLFIPQGSWCGDTTDRANNTCGPEGLKGSDGKRMFYLEGRIGYSREGRFKIGNGTMITTSGANPLFLRMNGTGLAPDDGHVYVIITDLPVILEPLKATQEKSK